MSTATENPIDAANELLGVNPRVAAYIRVKTTFEALHFWAEAPEEVGFLRTPHRHLFTVEITVPVWELNRSLEFFIIKRKIDEVIFNMLREHNVVMPNTASGHFCVPMSCETMAYQIGRALRDLHQVTPHMVCVREDEENSGIVVFR